MSTCKWKTKYWWLSAGSLHGFGGPSTTFGWDLKDLMLICPDFLSCTRPYQHICRAWQETFHTLLIPHTIPALPCFPMPVIHTIPAKTLRLSQAVIYLAYTPHLSHHTYFVILSLTCHTHKIRQITPAVCCSQTRLQTKTNNTCRC